MDGLDLRIMRVRAGITRYLLAQRSGIHPDRISDMERGQRPITDVVLDARSHEMSGAGREREE
jgi:transcriptional regulator with XRE-family HTH domain